MTTRRKSKTNRKTRIDPVTEIATQIATMIEEAQANGTPLPWRRPWATGQGVLCDTETVTIQPTGGHYNGCGGNVYNGVNQWFLAAVAMKGQYASEAWTTYKAAQKLAAKNLLRLGYVPARTKTDEGDEIVAGWDWSWEGEGEAPLGDDPCPGIRAGETATTVFFWKSSTYWVDRDGNTVRKPTKAQIASGEVTQRKGLHMQTYKVFNWSQCDSLPAPKGRSKVKQTIRIRRPTDPAAYGIPAEVDEAFPQVSAVFAAFAEATGCTLTNKGDKARYFIGLHAIEMPTVAQFVKLDADQGVANYCATLLHEMVHATGNAKVLDRQFGKRFGDQAYAFEELVAEIGSAALCDALGVPSKLLECHVPYVANWLSIIKDDKYSIHTAARLSGEALTRLIEGVSEEATEAPESVSEAA